MALPRTPDSDWPQDRETVRFVVRTAPDALGRQNFWALWWAGDRRRGQHFCGSLDAQVRQARLDGVDVEIIERLGSLRSAA